MPSSLPASYDPKIREKHWQRQWLDNGVYAFRDDQAREQTFVIDTPPPTVSGVLHMGHIFSYTQADFVARFQRMAGKDVCYPMGFDDNGLPTERLVEKVKGVRATAMSAEPGGRQKFVELCKEVVKDAEEEFRDLFKSVALSVDWNREYQTVSDRVQALSQASFLDLLHKNEAYRDFRPTYWDWVDQTAIAQAEIENKEMQGTMYDLQFTLEDGSPITIATTRPELLGACVAVMYHPEDINAEKYKNKKVITPLFNVIVEMIADEAVDKEFGSGLVMCCTYGDDTDKEWQRKYDRPSRPLIRKDGRLSGWIAEKCSDNILFEGGQNGINDSAQLHKGNCVDVIKTVAAYHSAYKDEDDKNYLKIKPAREKIVSLLSAEGKILNQKSITHTVKCAERSGTPIEIIPTYQWFVRITDKKEALKAKGASSEWHPEYMRIRLNQWIEGLKEDWCISRQRFFGVPFPVWYSKRAGEEGKILLPDADQLPVDPFTHLPNGYFRDEVEPDKDVMDTWATSSITPQINAGTLEPCKLFPADVRPQAHEIIRTWAFYTIAKAHLHADTIPWKHLMISGWCLAADKTKMSKSKGNVVTPVALIEEKGADAVRYWASTSRLGSDTAFSEDLLKIGRKLVTKLWNASNLVNTVLSSAAEDIFDGNASSPSAFAKASADGSAQSDMMKEPLDRWILTRLHRAVHKATQEFERFEYCDARIAIEDFFWNDFCDNYLELVKARAYGEGDGKRSALFTLHHCLHALTRLFAPFVPHVTEEIWSHLFAKTNDSVHARGNWPKAADYAVDEAAERAGVACVDMLNVIRKAKSEAGVSIKTPVSNMVVSVAADAPGKAELSGVLADLKAAGNVVGELRFGTVNGGIQSERGWYTADITLAPPEKAQAAN